MPHAAYTMHPQRTHAHTHSSAHAHTRTPAHARAPSFILGVECGAAAHEQRDDAVLRAARRVVQRRVPVCRAPHTSGCLLVWIAGVAIVLPRVRSGGESARLTVAEQPHCTATHTERRNISAPKHKPETRDPHPDPPHCSPRLPAHPGPVASALARLFVHSAFALFCFAARWRACLLSFSFGSRAACRAAEAARACAAHP
jgi:hypothetical protein